MGQIISMFGHLKGLQNGNEMQDPNFGSAVGTRIDSEMQESENHSEMQEPFMYWTLGENQVDEYFDPKSPSEVDELGDSENPVTSTPLQWNKKIDQKYLKGSLMLKELK